MRRNTRIYDCFFSEEEKKKKKNVNRFHYFSSFRLVSKKLFDKMYFTLMRTLRFSIHFANDNIPADIS